MTTSLDRRNQFRTITKIFDPVKFGVGDVSILDIAEGLCKTNRFSGQYIGDHMVSVAQHSVRVEEVIAQECMYMYKDKMKLSNKDKKQILRMRLIALLHDGSEGLTGDSPTPFKRMMPDFRKVENKIQNATYIKFLGSVITKEEEKLLSYVDFRVFNMECIALGRPNVNDPNIAGTSMEGETVEDHFGENRWWGIKESRERFLERFYDLQKQFSEFHDVK